MSSNPRLVSGGWPAGYGLHRLRETDSTNAEAARMAGTVAGPVWITADRQTAGRGRRGRPWASPGQALAATLLIRPDEPPATAALRSFVAALALSDAFQNLGLPGTAVALKWPNDVLLAGGKVAGILLESGPVKNGRMSHLAIGVGVNLDAAPERDDVEQGATPPIALSEVLGRRVAADDMLGALAAAWAKREAQFGTLGFAPIRTAWLDRAARLGQRIIARTVRDTHEGVFETVDDDGNLVLRVADGRRVLPAADVYF